MKKHWDFNLHSIFLVLLNTAMIDVYFEFEIWQIDNGIVKNCRRRTFQDWLDEINMKFKSVFCNIKESVEFCKHLSEDRKDS